MLGASLFFVACSNGNDNETQSEYFVLRYIAGNGGSVQSTSSLLDQIILQVNQGDDGIQITAVANSGWRFTSWSDGVTTAIRNEINVQADLTVTAQFTMIVLS